MSDPAREWLRANRLRAYREASEGSVVIKFGGPLTVERLERDLPCPLKGADDE